MLTPMAKKGPAGAGRRAGKPKPDDARGALAAALAPPPGRPSALLDTRVIYCGDCLGRRSTRLCA
jgi:hypothetical protein